MKQTLFNRSRAARYHSECQSLRCKSLLCSLLIFSSALFGISNSPDAFAEERVEVIKTDIERRDIKFDRIDSENFEITVSAGLLAIEDFDTGFVWNARLAYHLNERLFVEATWADSKGDLTSFEELNNGTSLISDSQRDYTSWDIALGLNLFPGETWLFGRAFSSDLYTVLGAGRTEFGGSNWTTITFGAGYRFFLTDWIALKMDLRDHVFNRNIFGEDDQTHNIELTLGASLFF